MVKTANFVRYTLPQKGKLKKKKQPFPGSQVSTNLKIPLHPALRVLHQAAFPALPPGPLLPSVRLTSCCQAGYLTLPPTPYLIVNHDREQTLKYSF